jgi:hypothetical protein
MRDIAVVILQSVDPAEIARLIATQVACIENVVAAART